MSKLSAATQIDRALFRIDWNRHTRDQQQAMLDACARPTLPQTPAYAAALAETGHADTEFGLMRFHGRPVGYVFVERRPLFRWGSSHRIYRGPLWLDDNLPPSVQREFFNLLRNRYRLRRGRPLTFHPELVDAPENRAHVASCGFQRIADGYMTIWLDLSQSRDQIRANLGQKWRNQLNQSERNDLRLDIDGDGELLDWLVDRHEQQMAARGYRGPSRRLITNLHHHGRDSGMLRVMCGSHDGDRVAGIIIARHGNSATYFVGWNGPAGRRLRANHFLLWQALCALQDDGVRWFDLGGINYAEAANVARFKEGLSKRRTTLVGGYT